MGDGEAAIEHFRCTSSSYGIHGNIWRCIGCGLLYTDDGMTDGDIAACYESVDDDLYLTQYESRITTFQRQLEAITERAGTGRLLEAGAYTGMFLRVARDAGWQVEGLEPSHWAVERAHELHGIELRQGLLGADDPPFDARKDGAFDAVVMWDVIEHLNDPPAAVRAAGGLLRPGGVLAMSTMDADSAFARLSGRRWPWLMAMHRVYFTRGTMRRMLEECGFTDIHFRNHVRWITVGYLTTRVERWMPAVGRAMGGAARFLRLDGVVVPFVAGDLFEVFARKAPDA